MRIPSSLFGTAAAAALVGALAMAPAFASGQTYNGTGPDRGTYNTPNSPNDTTTGMPSGTMSNSAMQSTAGVSLSRLHNAKQQLSNASVKDAAGATIGQVSDVRTNSAGHVKAVQVSLTSNNKTVAIPARDLRFDRQSNTLRARLSRTQIDRLPSI